jgi:hypothetical protein
MDTSRYGCKFSVLAVPERENMFLMNMRVYDIVPHRIEQESGSDPLSVIWCAVYNMSQMEKSN